MLALGFVALFLVIGLAVFFVAFRSGPKTPTGAREPRSRRISRPVLILIGILFIGFGGALPVLAGVYNADDQAQAARGGVDLTAAQERGRDLFKRNCATCHTLADAGAVGMVGPNLDQLRPAQALTLNAIQNGRAEGRGQMPAQLLTGGDARDVASYLAAVAGR
jgi:mono/diheme cytochrome c family protein